MTMNSPNVPIILKLAIGIANLIKYTDFSEFRISTDMVSSKTYEKPTKRWLRNMVSVCIGLQKLEQSYSKLSYSRSTFSKWLSLTFAFKSRFKLNGPLEGNNSSYNSLELLKYYSCTQCSRPFFFV